MVFQATQNNPTELEELSVERDVEADGYVVGFEDAGGSFVPVGRLENVADNITDPVEIRHENSGERVTLDDSAFKTSGDVRPGRNLILDRPVARTASGVIHQYRGQNFSNSVWPDSVSDADMLMNGPANAILDGTESVNSGQSDGVDDFGITSTTSQSGPSDLPENETFGVAFTFSAANKTDNSFWFAARDASGVRFEVSELSFFSGSLGQITILLDDGGGNQIVENTDSSFVDGNVHLVIINKTSNSNIDFFVDSVGSPVASTTQKNGPFDNTAYQNDSDMAFFARNVAGSTGGHKRLRSALFEFSTSPYSQSERQDLKDRRPEV
jgi:hypothetical protein